MLGLTVDNVKTSLSERKIVKYFSNQFGLLEEELTVIFPKEETADIVFVNIEDALHAVFLQN